MKTRMQLIDAAATDAAFVRQLLEQAEQAAEIYVLPQRLRRARQLLEGQEVLVGSFVDYPLGAGTLAKKVFEAGSLFTEGADLLEVTLNPTMIQTQNWSELRSLIETLTPLAFGRGTLRYSFAAQRLKELEKMNFAKALKHSSVTQIVIDCQTGAEAVHNASLFRLDGGSELELYLALPESEASDETAIMQAGANGILWQL